MYSLHLSLKQTKPDYESVCKVKVFFIKRPIEGLITQLHFMTFSVYNGLKF